MLTDAEFAALKSAVGAAATDRPAHCQTLRNRMLDAARETSLHQVIGRATDAEIFKAAAQLALPMTMLRVRVGGFGRPVPAWSKQPTEQAAQAAGEAAT